MVASKGGGAKRGGRISARMGASMKHGKKGGAKERVPHAPKHSGHDAKVRGKTKMGGRKHGGRMGRR